MWLKPLMIRALLQCAMENKHLNTTAIILRVKPTGGSLEGNATREETSRSEGAGVKMI